MNAKIPRIVLAGTGSGSGKTTIICALLQALKNREISCGAFKCGPDYIDPMFHRNIIGAESSNLDLFFFDDDTVKQLIYEHGKQRKINIIEGVMGFYDGMSLSSEKTSTYDVARVTDSPVVLIVNGKGAALSVLATIHGFLTFLPDSHIRGVILNHVSAMTYQGLKKEILRRFEGKVLPLGFLPEMKGVTLESRHLGLVTADEVTDLKEKMQLLAQQAETSLDIDGILALAEETPEIIFEEKKVPEKKEEVRIAVAQDTAFCFYYEDSLDVLRKMGAKIVPFSPLKDKELPENIQGLYLGGGYPELHTKELSENESMKKAIKEALERGLPCIAECGGFMYLTEEIAGEKMVGFLPGKSYNTGKLTRFGYVTLTSETDNMLALQGEQITGHEFHYWDSDFTGDGFTAEKTSGKTWDCVFATDTLYAGYPHFHFLANPAFAQHFYEACLKEKNR